MAWQQQYQLEDDDAALAKALELSRLENESMHKHSASSTAQTGRKIAIPLCLPNNCTWDSKTRTYNQTGERRQSLYVIEEALEELRKIKGPVCVVSIAGPYRKGKSYVLSQAFDQPQVFPLGHHMDPETMGIWLWIVPGKIKDTRGKEFTVVLLDSEGIDSVTGEGLDDNQIFTLTVLLASVLIYNSQGVPTRRDLEGLEFIVKLSQRIEARSKSGDMDGQAHRDSEFFHKTFPFFIWLLRDVAQEIPRDCRNLKEYFLKKVFKAQDSSAAATHASQQGQKVAESILRFFPGFEAFMLPSPTVDPELLKSINDNKSKVNPLFFRGLEGFKQLLRTVLVPKNSFNDGELVTGEGLAALVQLYVQAINCPGAIPNVQNAWDIFVDTKSCDAITEALKVYESVMESQLKGKLPCNNDELRNGHRMALEKSEGHFMAETAGISTNTTEQYLNKLKESLDGKFRSWQTRNEASTRESCNELLIQLKQRHLDPVLSKLRGKGGANLSFQDIIGGYNRIKEDFEKSAIGAKDVIAAVFFEFHPILMKEQEEYLGQLTQLKDYDEALAQELAAKAYQEQERQKLEEQQERLRQENRAVKKEMEMLGLKQNEERQKFREQMDKELQDQRVQMNNMMQANMEQARQERKEFMQENQDLRNQFSAIQKANEENIKMIEKLRDLVDKQEEEKRLLKEEMARAQAAREKELMARAQAAREKEQMARAQAAREKEQMARDQAAREKEHMARAQAAREREQMARVQAAREREELLKEMEERHKAEQEKLRQEMKAKMEAQRLALAEEYRQAITDTRLEKMDEMKEQLDYVSEQLEEVNKPNFVQKAWGKVKEFGCAVGRGVARAGAAVVETVQDNCSVM